MRLATALSERSDVQTRISQLGERLAANAKVQEGDRPAEDPQALLAELDGLCARLEELVTRINDTNARTVRGGESITAMLARRDAMKLKLSILRSFLGEASGKVDRYSRNEIAIRSTVDVTEMQKSLDRMSKELRELDDVIQELNWTTELL